MGSNNNDYLPVDQTASMGYYGEEVRDPNLTH